MALGDGIDSFVGWARSDHPLDAVFAGVEGRLSAASMLSNSNDPWDLIEAGRLNGSVGIDAALLVDGGLGVGRGVYSAGRAGVGVYREVQALDGPYSFSLAEAGSSTRASLSYDISQWGTYGLPSDGFFVRSLTPMQYTAWRNGLDVDFGGAPIGSYSPLNSAGRYVGFDDTGYPGGMGFVGSAEQLRGVTTQAGYRQATQLNYSPQYLVEFQLRNPTGLQNALYAPYELFERGGLTRGTNFSEFNYPGLRSTDTLNARFRELTGP
jgi:hypothetical protein